MKTLLPSGFFAFIFTAILMVMPSAQAVQVTYSVSERGIADLSFGDGESAPVLDLGIETDISTFQVFGSVEPPRVGLIGASAGFTASVAVPEEANGPFEEDEDNVFGGGGNDPLFSWEQVTIQTTATGFFNTTAEITGLSEFNSVGSVEFLWEITGTSSINLDVIQGFGDFQVNTAATTAILSSPFGIPDAFAHLPTPNNDNINDFQVASLDQDPILVAFSATPASPEFDVDFTFTVQTQLDVLNAEEGGAGFEAAFDANFSNTATLTSVIVLDEFGQAIEGASVVDSITGQSLVASTVPEPSTAVILILAGCAGSIRRRRVA